MIHPFLFLQWLVERFKFGYTSQQLADYDYFNHVTYAWMTMAILILAGFFASRKIKKDPVGLQNFMELILEQFERLIGETLGPKGRAYFPIIATLGLFILTSNLLALIPGFLTPTANINTTAALALSVFIMTHAIGFREHGLSYLKQFTGPIWWMIPLTMPIEIIGHLARPISLSLRLFGNMYGHEIVLMIFFFLAPVLMPLPMMFMGLLVAFIQAYVFTLLSMIYFASALEEAH